jgi:hypothetical protein
MQKALREGDLDQFVNILKTIFASIPYHNYANNIISRYEGYYASVVFVYLSALGYPVIPEDATNKGRIDLTLKIHDNVLIIEFKVGAEQNAIQQIREKRYYEKCVQQAKKIYLLGINFDTHEKNVSSYEIEEVSPQSSPNHFDPNHQPRP